MSVFFVISVPSYKGRVDDGLISVFEKLFTNHYSKNKPKFSFAFCSLIFVFSSLVRYNFEQVIVSRNYIILHSRLELRTGFIFLQLVNAVRFSCKQMLLFVRSEVTEL